LAAIAANPEKDNGESHIKRVAEENGRKVTIKGIICCLTVEATMIADLLSMAKLKQFRELDITNQ